MFNVALHVVGLPRSIETVISNFRSFVRAFADNKSIGSLTIFYTFWDKDSKSDGTFDPATGKINQPADDTMFPVDQERLEQIIFDEFSSFDPDWLKIKISFKPFDETAIRWENFLKIIYLSYLDRVRYELETQTYFDKVVLTRPDLVFSAPEEYLYHFLDYQLLSTQLLNVVNPEDPPDLDPITETPTHSIKPRAEGFFHFRKSNGGLMYGTLKNVEDFIFWGSQKEMNILMRCWIEFKEKGLGDEVFSFTAVAHAYLASHLIANGLSIGGNEFLFTRILRRIEGLDVSHIMVKQDVRVDFENSGLLEHFSFIEGNWIKPNK